MGTSNKWPNHSDAIVDRIIYNAHRIELKAPRGEKNQSKWAAEEPSLGRLTGSLDKALQQS